MRWFLEAIDLSENLRKGLDAARGMRGLSALVSGVVLLAICFGLAPLIWYFDIGATVDATDHAIEYIIPTLPADWAAGAAVFVLVLTLLPTLVELFTARFAAAGIAFASWLVYVFCLFDAVTDWERTRDFCETFRNDFWGIPWVGAPLFYAFRIFWLGMATFGFELLFVVFAVVGVVLVIVGMNTGARRVANYGE